jgi:phospholipid N-methyltransferase
MLASSTYDNVLSCLPLRFQDHTPLINILMQSKFELREGGILCRFTTTTTRLQINSRTVVTT